MINIFLAPTETGTGLTTISLGLIRALDEQGLKVGFLKPIAPDYKQEERSSELVRKLLNIQTPKPLQLSTIQNQVSDDDLDQVLENVVAMHAGVDSACDVVIIEGLVPDRNEPYTAKLNVEIAKALNADVVLVTSGLNRNPKQVRASIKLQAGLYGKGKTNQLGCIINMVGNSDVSSAIPSADATQDETFDASQLQPFWNIRVTGCPVMGVIPHKQELASPRMLDVARGLNAEVLYEGELKTRRVMRVSVCARTMPNMLDSLRPGTLVVTPGDREDILLATAMSALNGTPLAGLLITGGFMPSQDLLNLCQKAIQTGVPILKTHLNTFLSAQKLSDLDTQVPNDDPERVQLIMSSVTEHLQVDALLKFIGTPHTSRLSPAAFRYQIVAKARADKRKIVLPEGDEPRTIQAAIMCQTRGIADCILLGNPEAIRQVAEAQEVQLPEDLTIVDPDQARHQYIAPMVELRKHKQLTEPMAEAQLEDNVVLGTMMLATNEVDGLVSGAVHTTANTIRPALQLIKTAQEAKLVSSVFFMGLPDQVLVYGDCAVNPDPNAEELADIAMQSADSAAALGIDPLVAMISYSTGKSGTGADVEKVRTATDIVRQRRPDLKIDGPLQYDAATTASVAKSKAPDSDIAGRATVLIFPDLNTGNTTYKAVQRSANVISIGPMLQGLAKPVNDLSRGALVDDIVYTIALTAIQAQQTDTTK